MSSQLRNYSISLYELTQNIRDGKYTIPKFQRDFVWKAKAIAELGDSLVREYPISSLLTMPMSGKLDLAYEPLKIPNSTAIDDDTGVYVLDGQQRLSSIATIFTDFDTEKTYYFDLLAILTDRFPDDDFSILENLNSKINVDPEVLCRSFPRGKNKDFLETRHGHRFMSGELVVTKRFGSVINRYLQNFYVNNHDEDLIAKYYDHLSDVFGTLSNYDIQITEINESAELSLICRIFEKVNTTGVKLTTFDLINAKSFKYFEHGITKYFSDSLLNSKSNNSAFLDFYLSFDKKSNEFRDLGKLVRVLFLSSCIDKNKKALLTQSLLLNEDCNLWKSLWHEKKSTFLSLMDLFGSIKIKELLPASYLEYMISIVLSYPEVLSTEQSRSLFVKMLKLNGFALSLKGESFNKSDIIVFEKMVELVKRISLGERLSKTELLVIDHKIPPIEEIRLGRKSFKCAYYIMTEDNHKSLFTCDISGKNLKDPTLTFDEHHLIPKARFKSNNSKIFNSIANILPLNKHDNRDVIGERHPFEYLLDLLELNSGSIMPLEQNLIPQDFRQYSDEQFLIERGKEIHKYLDSYFIE